LGVQPPQLAKDTTCVKLLYLSGRITNSLETAGCGSSPLNGNLNAIHLRRSAAAMHWVAAQ